MKIIVASRCPYRPCSRAAFRSSSTSLGVRYSRGRRAALICRRGGTVPFSMFGSGRRRVGFVLEMRELGSMTVPLMTSSGQFESITCARELKASALPCGVCAPKSED
jgi:hypothetical protein